MSEQKISESVTICPRCQAVIETDSYYCWKCGARIQADDQGTAIAVSEYEPIDGSPSSPMGFSLSSLMLVVTLVAVCMALFVAAPGLGVLLAICSVPPLIRTALLINRRKALGRPVAEGQKALYFLGSLWVTIVIVVFTQIACVIAFFGSCLLAFGAVSLQGHGLGAGAETTMMAIAGGFTILTMIVVIWAFSGWVRKRWKRDTGQL